MPATRVGLFRDLLPASQICKSSEGVKPGIRNYDGGTLATADQLRQTFKPKLDVAKQLRREIFRPQLALAEIFPLLRRRFPQTASPHDPPQFHRLACAQGACAAKSGASVGVPELQLLEVIPVIAAVSRQESPGMSLGVCGQEKVRHNTLAFAPTL